MMISLLIRYVLPAMVIIGLLVWAGVIVHDNGRTVEREKWEAIAITERATAQQAIDDAREEVKREAHQQQLNLAEVINAKSEKIQNLNRDLLANDKRLFIPAKACPDNRNAVPRAAGNPVKPATTTSRTQLPPEITERLRESYRLAQETVILYQTCLGVVKAANVEIIYPVGEKKREN